jgi:aspartyl protease family protein
MIETFSRQDIISAAFAAIIFILVLSGALKSNNSKKLIKDISIWMAIVLVIVIGYAFRTELSYTYERVFAVLVPSSSWVNQSGELVIARSADGHFYLDAIINGTKIKFMVDTGASDIALTKNDAAKLKIDLTKLNFNRKYSTANGYNYAAPIVLQTVQIGKKIFQNVNGHVGQGDLDISLFGMSAIEGFKGFRIEKDMLILSY